MKKVFAFMFLSVVGGCMTEMNGDPNERIGETEQAAISNTVTATFLLDGATTNIRTGDMPKGWFTPKFMKSPISVAWSANATACHAAASGSFGSDTTGAFLTIMNPGGSLFGYSWLASHDVTGLENHWRLQVACDGTTTVIGCPKARAVNYTLSVGGACLTAGSTCTVDGSVSLPAIRDVDLVEINCPDLCDLSLGDCVSDCQQRCGDPYCSSCCECNCKDDLHRANDACEAPQSDCYNDKPTAPACL